jgi:hypothetical protein
MSKNQYGTDYSTEKIQRKTLLQEKKALPHTLSLIASEREKNFVPS